MRVVVVTYSSKSALEISLGVLNNICEVEKQDVIIASLNAGKEVEDYLTSQEDYRYILADENDTYSAVLNVVVGEFLEKDENLAIINEGMSCFPDTFSLAEKYIEEGAGAIAFDKLTTDDGEYSDLVNKRSKKNELYTVAGWGEEGIVLSGKMISEIENFDERFVNPGSILVDFLFACGQKGYKFYKSSDCVKYIFCNTAMGRTFGQDLSIIRDKWEMNYFTYVPNDILMNIIPADFNGEVNVLEVGCDCGGNGCGVREMYPNCHLYGLELNPHSAKIAATVYDEVIVGNAEEMDLLFGNVNFDIVIFGDVLEHLRDPLAMLKKCYARMNKGGVVITSIPNLMHYSVMKQLINGSFHYENEGLLDRTHIHFFTYYEIVTIFEDAGFKLEDALSTILGKPSEEDSRMIDTFVSMSGNTNRLMYETFQYNVRARK